MREHVFSVLMTVLLMLPIGTAAQTLPEDCGAAGRDAYFCFGDAFTQLEVAQGEGVTFWLHRAGYLSKVLVEDTDGQDVTQGQIERRILRIVSQQAESVGRDFKFSDLSATTIHGVPFGTFSYRLQGGHQDSAVLHSYVAVKGRVLQVVSQFLTQSNGAPAASLQEAHAEALRAVKLEALSSDA